MALGNQDKTKRIIVDNINNPMDVRPGVNRLLECVDKTLLTLPEDQTLFVGMAEDHSVSFCNAFFDATITGAQKRSYRSGISLELPFDTLYRTVLSFKPNIKPSIKTALLKNDRNNQLALNAVIAHAASNDSPVGRTNSSINTVRSGLPVNFHDLSIKELLTTSMKGRQQEEGITHILDQDDPATRAVIEKIAPSNLGYPINVPESLISTDIRDEFGFNNIEAFAKQKNSGLFLSKLEQLIYSVE